MIFHGYYTQLFVEKCVWYLGVPRRGARGPSRGRYAIVQPWPAGPTVALTTGSMKAEGTLRFVDPERESSIPRSHEDFIHPVMIITYVIS